MTFFDLPSDISITVLRDWTGDHKTLAELDVACGHAGRSSFHSLLREPALVLARSPLELNGNDNAANYVQWVNNRLVKVRCMVARLGVIGSFTKLSYSLLRTVEELQLINDNRSVRSGDLRTLLMLLPSLTTVHLEDAGATAIELVLAYLSTMPHLKLRHIYLHQSDSTVGDMCGPIMNVFGFTLETLDLGIRRLDGPLLMTLVEKCAHLQSLTISFANGVTSQMLIDNFGSMKLPQLSSLTVRDNLAVVSDAVVVAICKAHPILVTFHVFDATLVTISSCSAALQHCHEMTSFASHPLDVLIDKVKKSTTLIIYCGRNNNVLLAAELPKIVACRSHYPVHYFDCGGEISSETILVAAAQCPEMTVFDCDIGPDVGDDALCTLVISCNRITKLLLNGCEGITDVSLQGVADHCQHLSELALAGAIQITNAGLHSLLQKRGQTLKVLRLSGSAHVNSLSLAVIVAFCPTLLTLCVTDTAVTADDIMDSIILPDAFARLKQLFVEETLQTAVSLLLEKMPKSRWTEILVFRPE